MFRLFRRNNNNVNEQLSGTWKGRYRYEEGYEASHLAGKEVAFTLKLHVKGKRVKGICIDDETKDVFSKASSIKGTFANNRLEFIKQYPSQWTSGGGREVKAETGQAATPIRYFGILMDDAVHGHWVIAVRLVDELGQAFIHNLKGTWHIAKEVKSRND